MEQWGRTLILVGGIIALVGVFLTFGSRLPFRIGRLPFDFHFEGSNYSVYVPIGTSIVVSIILTILMRLLTKR